jgi:SAM-dependent methyltransferase
MSYSSSEKQFYQRQYGGGLQVGNLPPPEAVRATHFAPGKRYHLIERDLRPGVRYGTALEVGCADGQCIGYLASQYSFAKVIGVDIGFADDMRSNVGGVEFVQANFNHALPLPNGTVDVLVAMMVIEHLFDPFASFAEVKRLLAPQGSAYINLPLVTSIKNRLRLLLGQVPQTSVPYRQWFADKQWDGNHLHYFSMSSIEKLAADAGLRVTGVAACGRFHQLKTLAPSFLANEVSFVMKHA